MTTPETPPWVNPETCTHPSWHELRDGIGGRWWGCKVCRTITSQNPLPDEERVVISRGQLDELRRTQTVARRQTDALLEIQREHSPVPFTFARDGFYCGGCTGYEATPCPTRQIADKGLGL